MSDRYARHLRLEGFGEQAQKRLRKSSILIIGCGGLGCPAAMYLSRSGVGKLGLIDEDKVSLSNLHRQVLFAEKDVGEAKVNAAEKRLKAGNSELEVETYPYRLDTSNYDGILPKYDLVLDCTDNFLTRYLVNDACVAMNIPMVYGAVNQYEGQVAVFNYNGSAQLRDVFPDKPQEGVIQNCEEAGVLGVVAGMMGEFMALEAIKVLTGVGTPLINQMLIFDGLNTSFHRIRFSASKSNIRAIEKDRHNAMSFRWNNHETKFPEAQLLDVRTPEERANGHRGGVHIPLSELESRLGELEAFASILCYCKSGQRAQEAASILSQRYVEKNIAFIRDVLN